MTQLFSDIERDSGSGLVGVNGRRLVMLVFTVISAVGLLGLIGQRTSDSIASTPSVRMRLSAPEGVRGGLFFQSRARDPRADADRASAARARQRLDRGHAGQLDRAGRRERDRAATASVVLSYGALEAGDVLRVWLQFEVDPTSVGKRSYTIELDDEDRAAGPDSDRDLRVLP